MWSMNNLVYSSIFKTIQVTILLFLSIKYGESLDEGESCFMPDFQLGTCRKIRECIPVVERLKTKQMSFHEIIRCSFNRSIEVICCPNYSQTTTTELISTNASLDNQLRNNTSNTIGFEDKMSTTRKSAETRTNARKSEIACANYSKKRSMINYNIIKGEDTTDGEFPHMAALGYPSINSNNLVWDCGGSLISERFVLTAAHCVKRKLHKPVLVRLGIRILEDQLDILDGIEIGIEKILEHPEYSPPKKYNDIALIKLENNIDISETVRPCCLYTNIEDPKLNTYLVATGWGSTSLQTRQKSSSLLKTNLTIVSLNNCNQSYVEYGQVRYYPNGLQRGQLCAFDPAQITDTCEGDSGGPLQIVGEGGRIAIIIGITSFGVSCASQIPGVFTRVAFYLDWIESIVW